MQKSKLKMVLCADKSVSLKLHTMLEKKIPSLLVLEVTNLKSLIFYQNVTFVNNYFRSEKERIHIIYNLQIAGISECFIKKWPSGMMDILKEANVSFRVQVAVDKVIKGTYECCAA